MKSVDHVHLCGYWVVVLIDMGFRRLTCELKEDHDGPHSWEDSTLKSKSTTRGYSERFCDVCER